MQMRVRAPDAYKIAADMGRASFAVTLRSTAVVKKHGQLLLTTVKAKASGRPGPNAPTGDYRRSWNLKIKSSPRQLSANVGTNKPQGRRLEYGFVGTDSLGRTYNQPPYPHAGPAFDIVAPKFEKEMGKLSDKIVFIAAGKGV